MKFAPQEVFEQILEWAVIPTFDLVIEVEDEGFLLAKRKIAPYKDQWALPGLRMYKGESIDETVVRIAQNEIGVKLDPRQRQFLGQYVGKFKAEHRRQDLSTGYYFKVPNSTQFNLNKDHFLTTGLLQKSPLRPARCTSST